MDRSDVQSVADRELGPLLARLGLAHWDVRCDVGARADDDDGTRTRGECTRLADYHDAQITLNPEAFDDDEGVLRTLRHELFHVVLADFDLYTSLVSGAVDGPAGAMLERVREHATEQAVIALERMWAGLTGTVVTIASEES